ncbi:MAG TPA: BTAD domain-containing putative transcriptional regulator [Actinophytocola sp.]|jgi:DNA-binding SARP family transcriptional activator|nr:BTAD domain-containing putative transcriptional regulator [Actinophytocola sp.]
MSTHEGLRIEVLGPLRAWRSATEIPLGPPRQRAVFAALAVRAGRVVSRTELVAAVWGETPPASAEGNLHTYVSHLRRALDPARPHRGSASLISSDAAGYALRVRESDVDAAVFERACAEAGRGAAGEDFASVVEALDAALGLWRGDALSGVPGPLAESERERLAQLRLAAVEQRAAAALALGGHRELCAELAGLVREHPVRESLRELLMLALYRSGRHTEALEVFREARQDLVRELGIEPGEGLRRLHEQVLAFDPALDLPAEPARRPGGFVSAPPAQARRALEQAAAGTFVGRAAEVERLWGLVAGVAAGRGGALWIEGEPGVGTTSLLAVALSAGADGCRIAWGTCQEMGSEFPLEVLTTALGAGAVADRLAAGDPVPLAVDQLLSHVDTLGAKGPLVLVVDNLQWVDETSLLVLHRLTALTRNLPLLLVVACRPLSDTSVHAAALPRLRDRVDAGGGTLLRLGPLSDADTAELASRIVGGHPGPRLRELVARAAGNPFYVREILQILLDDGAVTCDGDTVELSGPAPESTAAALLDAVDGRLGYLSAQARTMLNWAALLGTEFTAADVAAVTDRPATELARSFEEAIEAGILVDAGAHLEFRHSLVHDVFYARLRGPARDVLHEQAARALAGAGAPVARVARQLAAAPAAAPLWMVEWLAEHHRALSNRAPLVAVELLERAVEQGPLDNPPDNPLDTAVRQVLLVALVRVLFRLGRAPEDLARAALDVVADPFQAADVREMLATMLDRRGEKAAAVELIELWTDDDRVPEVWRSRHRQLLADFRRGGLDDLPAVERAARDELARAKGDAHRAVPALQTLWLVCSVRRDHQQALALVDRAIGAVGRHENLAAKHLELLGNRTFTLQNLDALAEVDRTLAAATAIAGRHALPPGLRAAAAVHDYWTGRWEDALVELDLLTADGPVLTCGRLREPAAAFPVLHGVAALVAARQGDVSRAAGHLDAAADHGADTELDGFLHVTRSTLAERDGDPAAALRALEPLLERRHGRTVSICHWLPRLVRLAVAVGDTELTNRALAACTREAAAEVLPARAYAAAEWARGLVCDDPALVLRAAAHYRKVGRRVELADALADAGVLLGRSGAAADAAAVLSESLEVYTELATGWDIRRAGERLAEVGAGTVAQPAGPWLGADWESLSPGEVRNATLAASGYADPAGRGGPGRRSIQTHVAGVLRRLDSGEDVTDGVRSRAQDS